MMISPDYYVEIQKDKSYEELIEERDQLIDSIQEFERLEKAGDRSGKEWQIHPSPEVRYQMHLEYLAKLCSYMSDRYNKEYVYNE